MQNAICPGLMNGPVVAVPSTAGSARPWMAPVRARAAGVRLPSDIAGRAVRMALALVPWSVLAGAFLFL